MKGTGLEIGGLMSLLRLLLSYHKAQNLTYVRRAIRAIIGFIGFTVLNLILVSNISAWWSGLPTGPESVHSKIGDAAFDSISQRLSNEFLKGQWDTIVQYTYYIGNDIAAHGGIPAETGEIFLPGFKIS